ncbi:MAG: NADH-quinone oxidoreductase subunit C [Chloroflexota bacterium]|nr:NADH-quinone oxidoreductase subunit C [Chloroflexota bacterium]
MANETGQEPAKALTTPVNPLAEATVALLNDQFGASVSEVVEYRGETTVTLAPEALVEVCRALRDAPGLRYDMLEDLTAVDWLEREPRYDVIYQLLSLQTRASVRLKIQVGGEDEPDPEVTSVMGVWASADWYEREVYDLFGIRFTGREGLTRILMPSDWVGYPLRKDYPITGFSLPDPHWGGQVPLNQPLDPGIGDLTSRTADGSERPNAAQRSEDDQ